LITIGLVAGSKSQLDETPEGYWNLGYSYYLKAFAEMTFLAARKQGVVLQEDFSKNVDGDGFNLEFFKRKAQTSLEKCQLMLS
jgi:hypothetical protein